MSMPQVFSIGIGVVLRGIINSVGARNDKLAGALSGIWDGIVAYAAWRTDRLLEPTVLIEIMVGICFDALYHGTPARLISLALGTVLGVLVSDTAGLHTLWDDLGENVQEKLKDLDFRDDLDSPDVLSEFSEDVTVVYEERATALSPRTRKMTTTEWIAAQRKAREHRSSKSATTSRRASASMNISTDLDRSILLSGFDSQTQVTTRTTPSRTTQTQSSRARRDRELLESMTPLPPPSAPSVARNTDFEINIDVFSPSIATRISSPTIKTEIIEEPSIRGTHEGTAINMPKNASKMSGPPKSRASRSHRSSRRASLPASVKPESTHPAVVQPLSSSSTETERAGLAGHDSRSAFSERSGHSTAQHLRSQTPRSRHTHTGTERTSFSPFIPPRPADSTREPTIISAHESHSAHVLPEDPNLDHVAAEVLSSWDDGLYARSVRSKSRASTRHSERFVEEPSVHGTQSHHTTIRSEGSVRPEGRAGEGPQGYVQSEASQRYSERPVSPSLAPEVIIDYSGETTRIYIPPPAETGINVRIVPRAEETQADQGLSEVHNSGSNVDHDHDYLDANYHYSGQSQSLAESAFRSQNDIVFIPQSIGSFPELETVPPVEEHNVLPSVDEDDTHHSHHSHASRAPSHASRAELSGDPQPPSIFKLKRAWRSSGSAPPASSPTTDFGGGGRVLEPDDPLPVYVTENVDDAFLEPAHVYIARSRSPSRSPSNVGNQRPEDSPHRRSHSQSAASRHAHSRSHSHSRSHNHNQNHNAGQNTLELDMQGEASGHLHPETKTPSVERFGPARSQTQSRDRNYSRSRRQSDASHDRRHSGAVVPIARSQDPRQSATFIDSPTVDGSIHRPSPNRSPNANSNANVNITDLATRAVQWEQQAIEMDTRCEALRVQIRDAERHGQNTLVFTLSCELENAEQRAKRLRRRAERAQLAAREAEHDDRIDVHRLSPLDAFQAVKNALYAIQQKGRSKLTVVVDHGRRAAEGSSVKRYYIIDKITKKYHFDVRSDEMNPNILYIFFPPNP